MVGTSWTRKKRNRCPSPSPVPSPSPAPSPSPTPSPCDCPMCFEPFTNLIFQFNNGHLACSSCSKKLRNKCLNCTLPSGNIRCRSIEKIVESITVPCPNSIFGCTEILPCKDQKPHGQKCLFSLCSCPLQDCKNKGNYKDLYHHFDSTHKSDEIGYDWYVCGTTTDVWMHKSENIFVLKEAEECLLFVIQRFSKSNGEYVRVSCVGPFGLKFDRFSYCLSMSNRYKIKYEPPEMKKVQEVNFETFEEENFLWCPRFLTRGSETLKMKLKVRKLKQK